MADLLTSTIVVSGVTVPVVGVTTMVTRLVFEFTELTDRQLVWGKSRLETAAQALLGTKEGVTRLRGKWHKWHGIPLMVTFHPSYLLRIPDPTKQAQAKRDVWDDMKKLLQRMGRPIPQSKK